MRFKHRIASIVIAAALVASPSVLAAQGAKESGGRGRVGAVAESSPSPSPSHAQPARGILATLVGTWRFEVWFAGNYSGPADAAGTRVIHSLYDDLRVEWTEALDHSAAKGQGIVGFDPAIDRFFWSAVYSTGAAPELLTGVLDDAQPTIAFRPVAGGDSAAPAALTMVDDDHFTWGTPDRSWRAVFTRQR